MKYQATALILLVGLALCGDIAAQPRRHDDACPVRTRLQQHGIQDEAAERIAAIFAQALEENVDTSILRTRLHEGLAKQVAPAMLAKALETRLDFLRSARSLLLTDGDATNDGELSDSERAILHTLAQTLESGVSATALSRLSMPRRDEPGLRQRMQAIIESAEVLHLAGVGAPDIQRFIDAGIEKEAGRGVIIRVTADWIELHRQGLDGETISSQIWPREQHGHRRQQRQHRRATR